MPNDRTERWLYLITLVGCLLAFAIMVAIIIGAGHDVGWW